MNKLKVLTLPNPILKSICQQVKFPLDQQTYQSIQSLKNSFRESFIENEVKTLGLAAPQIGITQRFFIMPKNTNIASLSIKVLKAVVRNFNVYINPKVLEKSEKEIMIVENCLSLGKYANYEVVRSQSIKVEYYNMQGKKVQQQLKGLRARVFLHEYDHLDGVTMDERGKPYIPQSGIKSLKIQVGANEDVNTILEKIKI